MSPQRPTSVTVIGWILLVLGAIGFLGLLCSLGNPMARQAMAASPVPFPVQIALSAVGLGVSIVSGFFLLKGANWARFLYIVWSVAGFAFSLATSPAKLMLVPGIAIFLVIAAFLLAPKASAYFTGKPDDGA